jgi:PKD repeat protein
VRGVSTAILTAVVLLAASPPASAVIVHLPGGKALSYQPLRRARPFAAIQPFDLAFSNADYNGGPVMASNTNYMIYWSPSGAGAYPSGYITGINRYFEDLAHDSGGNGNVDSVASQYNDAAGEFANYSSLFGEGIVDTDPYPANGCTRAATCLTDAQIQAELTSFVKGRHLPTDLAHEYFLLTPPGVQSCFDAGGSECSAGSTRPIYCAYHGNIPVAGGQLIYANDPYVTGIGGCDDGNHPNESPSDGALEGGLSHEHNESTTDPEPNNAWTDFGSPEPAEIGDKCGESMGSPLGKAPDGATYNQVINGHFYWYQEEWSNQGHQCLQRLSFSGERPKATFVVIPEGPSKVRFDATGSTAPGGVAYYNWQFNEGGEPGLPIEMTTPTITGEFAPGESRLVALTVFAHDGTSIGTARTFTPGGKGPTATFSASTTTPSAGQTVSFDASSSTDPEDEITSFAWEFGDGTTQSGVSATHAFASSGTYEVRLSVTDSAGLSAIETQQVVVEGTGSGGPPTQTVETVPTSTKVPPPPGTLSATIALAGTSMPVQGNGHAAIKLVCAGNAPVCVGQMKMTIKIASGKGARRRVRTVTIATGGFSVKAGQSTLVQLRLNATGRALLRARGGHLQATLIIVKSSPAPLHTQSRVVRLNLQKAAASKRHR